jgi:hypothetical protein
MTAARESAGDALERSAREELVDAHRALDAAGVPRELPGGIRLSIIGRIDWLDRRRFRPAEAHPQSTHPAGALVSGRVREPD